MTTLHCPLGIPLLAWNEPGANRCESLPRRRRSRSSSRTMQEIEKFRSDFMFTWKNKRKRERKRRRKRRTARTAA